MTTDLLVSEVFGPTVQGEGPECGRASMFVRLGGCNLACSYCDTPYTWDWKRYRPSVETHKQSIESLVCELNKAPAGISNIVATGGEPMLQRDGLCALQEALRASGRHWRLHIETAGTIAPGRLEANIWVVSPKLSNSGNTLERALKYDVLMAYRELGAAFKFVVQCEADVREALALSQRLRLPRHRVWCMPEGITVERQVTVGRALVDEIVSYGFNLTLRQHILLWGNERKR